MRRTIIPYNRKLIERARYMRNHPTPSERALWQSLKGKQLCGYDFHRQKTLGNFIVDFYCCELFLAVEVDGPIHNYQRDRDRDRQEAIENMGVRFLRFTDRDVLERIDKVVATIVRWIEEHGAHPSRPDSSGTRSHPSQEG